MCGVAFFYQSDLSQPKSIERMEEALNRLQSRGPDARELWHYEGATAGHVRLSILDLDGSHQPMHSPDGKFTIVFNGEIYNYKELRDELLHKWQFKTQGDTEVLLAGLILYGEAFIPKMEGMWAFALWDNYSQTVFLGRDRTGKKPLFYSVGNQGFACASELPALNAICGKKWEEDLHTTSDYFRYGYPLPGRTFYKNVYELKPATILKWSKLKGVSESCYWKPVISLYSGNYSTAQARLRELMDKSISRRLISDVEVGSFLSGGIDSSIVSALAAEKQGNSKLKTFTIGFDEAAWDERVFARKVANHIGVEHHESILKSWSSETLKDLLLERVGQPFQDSSLLPTAEVSKIASSYVKVALSGDGSDELFCGYQRYKARAILNTYLKAPVSVRHFIRRWVNNITEPDVHHSRSLVKKLHLFMDVVDRREEEDPYVAPVFFSRAVFARIFPKLSGLGYQFNKPFTAEYTMPDIKKMMFSDTFVYLPQDIHTKVDRASMAHSLETRAPFMDTAVVEFALSLPLKYGLSWQKNKKILADTFKDKLPKDIWVRRKQGFGVPISVWFRGELGDQLEGMLRSEEDELPLVKEEILLLLNRHRENDKDFGYRLWLVYVYLVWKKECSFLD